MRIHLVHITTLRSGARAEREELFDGAELKIGRGTDSHVHIPALSVPFHHSSIVEQAGGSRIETRAGSTLLINGHLTTAKLLADGDVIAIADYELRVRSLAEEGVPTLQIERVERPGSPALDLRARTKIGIEGGLLSRRFLSFAGLAGVLGFFLVWPLLATPRSDDTARGIGRETSSRWVGEIWNVGTISRAHQSIATDCTACHVRGFEQVANARCLACHEPIADPTLAHADVEAANEVECTNCHREHEGDAGLNRVPDRTCTACHGNLDSLRPQTSLANVTDFVLGHPEFRPAVTRGETRIRVSLDRMAEGSAGSASGLHFPHDVHLQADLRSPEGPVELGCADCHDMEPSGGLAGRVDFQSQCAGCHSLAFAEEDPDRLVPHGPAEAVRTEILEYYAARALEGAREGPPPDDVTIRRPGRKLDEAARREALEWARERSRIAIELTFAEEGPCAQCHVLDGPPDRAVVAPVRLIPLTSQDRWLPLAVFDHHPHRTMECEGCHAARTSDSANDLLLPSIETCRGCHVGEEVVADRISSPCVSCHRYHAAGHGAWLADGAVVDGRPES